ncbi:iron-sulfur cluster-binding domain-containing protein [Nocardia sp. NPDC051833]|uniref:flavin reductase family protein n=1 Tax=Nocardia sp. NPDC051833 TaxID=3155674 RepID=UPI003445403E
MRSLVYPGRTADSLAFLEDLRATYGSRVRVRLDADSGLPTAKDVVGDLSDGAEVYWCGPIPLMDLLRKYLAGRGTIGWHYERFSPPPVINGKPFQVRLASDGTVLDVPADATVLETVRAARPDVLFSCRQGFCGSCRTRVLEGSPIHHGTALTEAEQTGQMLLCVSPGARAPASSWTCEPGPARRDGLAA